MSDFVVTPMPSEFVTKPTGYKGGAGEYDGCDYGPFAEHNRTPSPNGVPEKFYEREVKPPSGEGDQF